MPDHNNKPDQPKPEGKLVGIRFMPDVAVSLGGKHTSMTYWDRKKMVDEQQPQDRVMVKELSDGGVRVSTADGFVRIVESWAIAWRMYEPEGRK